MDWTEQHDIPFPLIAIDTDKELKRLCDTLPELVRGYPSLEGLEYCGKGLTNRRDQLKSSGKAVRFQDQYSYLYLQEARRILEERKREKDKLKTI